MSEAVPDPARVVADADVLVADLLVGGASREALELVWTHSWLELIASEALLADATHVVTHLADAALAADWQEMIREEVRLVEPTLSGHPALAAAAESDAASVLSLNPALQRPGTGAAIRSLVATSVKSPTAFVTMTDPAVLYPTVVGGSYPGPDRAPRS